ncbi:MAG: aminopeptidase P family N-terminal domain-containing protein, partial [Actinomycetota bacterium]
MTTALAEVVLPDFGVPEAMPEIPAAVYRDRLERLRVRMDEQGYDRLVVYADREHSANLSYLTGFDPRFEEAVLVVGPDGEPAILVGNECFGMAGAAPLPMRRHLFQDLSLPGQPRDRSRPLADLLAEEGIRDDNRVGVVGWKGYADRATIEVPAFLVDELRRMTPAGLVENAAHLLIGAA